MSAHTHTRTVHTIAQPCSGFRDAVSFHTEKPKYFLFLFFFSSIVRYYLSRHFFTPLLLDASSTLNKLNFPVETDSGGGQRRITNVLEAGRQSVINDVSPLQATMRKEMERFFSSNRGWGAAVPRKFPFPPFSLLLLIEEKSQENANNKLISFKIE